MEFLLLHCPDCGATFYTANDRATHHLEAHERRTRRDGTLLVPTHGLAQIGGDNGLHTSVQAREGA